MMLENHDRRLKWRPNAIVGNGLYLFTQSFVMPDIGKADEEASPVMGIDQPPGLQALRITIDGANVDPERDRVRIPRCEERHRAAIYMGLLMSRFVWFHELAHCINGHVLFMRDQRLSGSLISAAAPLGLVKLKTLERTADDQRRLRHILETDADLTALEWLLRIHNGGAENIQGLLAYDDAQRFKMTIIGTYIMTWLFEEYQRFADQTDNLIRDEINGLQQRKLALEETLHDKREAPVYVHPNMALRYQQEVQRLLVSLNDPEHRDESAKLIRKLIDKIVLTPNGDGSALTVDLHGDLAGILRASAGKLAEDIGNSSGVRSATELNELQQIRLLAGPTGTEDSCEHTDRSRWLGRKDSNLRMAVPKTAALPLGYAPARGRSIAAEIAL